MHPQLAPLYFKPCDEKNSQMIFNFLYSLDGKNTPSLWYHDSKHYPMRMFTLSKHLYYEYCCYKEYKPLLLKNNLFHKQNANIVNDRRAKGIKASHSEGVTDHFYGFESKYVSYEEHFNYDPCHVLKNIYDYLKYIFYFDSICLHIFLYE